MRRLISTVLVCSALAWASAPAGAQTGGSQTPQDPSPPDQARQTQTPDVTSEEELAAARMRFREGVAAAEAGDFRTAADAFRAALAVRDAAPVRFNLASALFELGEDPEAFRLVRGLQRDESAPAELRERAAFLERELRARNSVLSIQLGGQADGARLDGRDLDPAELAEPFLVAPGERELVGLRGGDVVTRRALRLRAGTESYVDVSVVPSPAEAAREEVTRENDAVTRLPEEAPSRSRTGLYVGIAAAVVAVAAAAVVVVLVTRDGTEAPVRGDFEPGVIRW